jgi:Pre ATP-grasp domain
MSQLLQNLGAGTGSRLFVHCTTSIDHLGELRELNPGVERYAERALLLANRDDLVCVPEEVESDYLEFLEGLGLGPAPENLIVTSRFQSGSGPLWERLLDSEEALAFLEGRMQLQKTAQLHPFCSTAGQFELARALSERTGRTIRVIGGDPDLVAYADSKEPIRAKALELGVPVARGEVVEMGTGERPRERDLDILRSAIERQSRHTGRVMVRRTGGAASSATFIYGGAGDLAALEVWLAGGRANRTYLVESMVNPVVSPSVQIYISPDASAECVGITDQLLDRELTHRGNAYPTGARCSGNMVRWACRIGEWLGDMGYTGIAGFDFVEYIAPDGNPGAFLAELNPRVNSATYPLAVRERISPTGAFVAGTIEMGVGTFAELRERMPQLLYSLERKSGILPYMTGSLSFGSCGIIALAPCRAEAAELYGEAELSLGASLAGIA